MKYLTFKMVGGQRPERSDIMTQEQKERLITKLQDHLEYLRDGAWVFVFGTFYEMPIRTTDYGVIFDQHGAIVAHCYKGKVFTSAELTDLK